MSLALTPQMLAAAYEYLRTTPPFRSWKLPPEAELKFHVTRHKDRRGDCWQTDLKIGIRISSHSVAHSDHLLEIMAHEMIHVKQKFYWQETKNYHNADFIKDAKLVCRYHGFDPKAFL